MLRVFLMATPILTGQWQCIQYIWASARQIGFMPSSQVFYINQLIPLHYHEFVCTIHSVVILRISQCTILEPEIYKYCSNWDDKKCFHWASLYMQSKASCMHTKWQDMQTTKMKHFKCLIKLKNAMWVFVLTWKNLNMFLNSYHICEYTMLDARIKITRRVGMEGERYKNLPSNLKRKRLFFF